MTSLAELRAEIKAQIDWVFDNCDRRVTINLDDILKTRIRPVLATYEKEAEKVKVEYVWCALHQENMERVNSPNVVEGWFQCGGAGTDQHSIVIRTNAELSTVEAP